MTLDISSPPRKRQDRSVSRGDPKGYAGGKTFKLGSHVLGTNQSIFDLPSPAVTEAGRSAPLLCTHPLRCLITTGYLAFVSSFSASGSAYCDTPSYLIPGFLLSLVIFAESFNGVALSSSLILYH